MTALLALLVWSWLGWRYMAIADKAPPGWRFWGAAVALGPAVWLLVLATTILWVISQRTKNTRLRDAIREEFFTEYTDPPK